MVNHTLRKALMHLHRADRQLPAITKILCGIAKKTPYIQFNSYIRHIISDVFHYLTEYGIATMDVLNMCLFEYGKVPYVDPNTHI